MRCLVGIDTAVLQIVVGMDEAVEPHAEVVRSLLTSCVCVPQLRYFDAMTVRARCMDRRICDLSHK